MAVSADVRAEGLLLLDLRPEAGEVSRARREIRSYLSQRFAAEVVEVAESLVSEMVTNAVLHAGTSTIGLTASQPERGLLEICVSDGNSSAPRETAPAAMDEHGRGLLLCRALADGFGWRALPAGGKAVWARLRVDQTTRELAAQEDSARNP